MVKLCWIRDTTGHAFHYYYNQNDKRIYCVDLQEYEKKQSKFTPAVAMIFVGPAASCISALFRGRNILLDKGIIVFLVFFSILGILSIGILSNKSQKKQDAYILSRSVGEVKSKQQILFLFKAGKNYRAGIIFFIALSLTFAVYAIQILRIDQSATGIPLFYIGIYGAAIWLNILSPIELVKIKLSLNKV